MTSFHNLISILRNAQQSTKEYVFLPKKRFSVSFLKFLLKEGFVCRISELKSKRILKVYINYTSNNTCSFKDIVLFSKFDKIFYMSYSDLTKISQGAGTLILSTNKGLSTLQSCLKKKTGGVLLAYIN